MIVNVVKKECKKVDLERYYVLRGVADLGIKKGVVAEQVMPEEPTLSEIAEFLINNPDADFCSVVANYRIRGEEKVDEAWQA